MLMRRGLIALAFVLFLGVAANAQTITGKIVDSRNEPIEAVTVVAQTIDSVFVDAAITDSTGCLDAGFNIKDRIKLFQINSLFKCPIGRFLAVVHRPFFCIHPITCHSRVGYKSSYSQCIHHR